MWHGRSKIRRAAQIISRHPMSTSTQSNKKVYFVHPHGICESDTIGMGTRIWAFAHVLPNARIGKDCNICDHVFMENDVIIGDRVTVKSGVEQWDGLHIKHDVIIVQHATCTTDKPPRSKQ